MDFTTILAEMKIQERNDGMKISKVTMSYGYFVRVASSMKNNIHIVPYTDIAKLLGVEIDVIPMDTGMWYTVEVEPLEW